MGSKLILFHLHRSLVNPFSYRSQVDLICMNSKMISTSRWFFYKSKVDLDSKVILLIWIPIWSFWYRSKVDHFICMDFELIFVFIWISSWSHLYGSQDNPFIHMDPKLTILFFISQVKSIHFYNFLCGLSLSLQNLLYKVKEK